MLRINEYDLEPGIYRHYKGGMYVVVDLVTHMDNKTTGKMELLSDPLVVYRDIEQVPGHDVKGRSNTNRHMRYARIMSEFNEIVTKPDGTSVKRFTKE